MLLKFLEKLIESFTPPVYIIKNGVGKDNVDGYLVPYIDETSYITEQYKILRTNLYSLSGEKNIKTVVITSSQAEEGKTVTSCNTAFILSLDKEKKTLLIDMDLRKPRVNKLFGLPRKPGLSDIIDGTVSVKELLKNPACGNLYIITSGSTTLNSSEILSSTKLKEILEELKSRFDYIILDTPPVLNVTDASIIGSFCDAVILVVKAGVTQKNTIEEAFHLLKDAQASPKACILTNASITNYRYYLSKYTNKYKYSYGNQKKKE